MVWNLNLIWSGTFVLIASPPKIMTAILLGAEFSRSAVLFPTPSADRKFLN